MKHYSYEFKSLSSKLKYWDKCIDQIKSKGDKCEKLYRFSRYTAITEYWKPSKR